MDIKNILERIKIRETEKELCIRFDTEDPPNLALELAQLIGANIQLAKKSLQPSSLDDLSAVYSLNQIAIALILHQTEKTARSGVQRFADGYGTEETWQHFRSYLDSLRRLKQSLEREELELAELVEGRSLKNQ